MNALTLILFMVPSSEAVSYKNKVTVDNSTTTPVQVAVSSPTTGQAMPQNQVAISSSSPTLIYDVDNTRVGNCTVCNITNVPVWTGGVSVSSTSDGQRLNESVCRWPEGPAVYQGALYGIAEGANAKVTYECLTN